MFPKSIQGFTRNLAPPNELGNIPCVGLPIRDIVHEGIPWMISAWELEPSERAALLNGEPVYLWIQGYNHPMVAITTRKP